MCNRKQLENYLSNVHKIFRSLVNTRWFKYDRDYLCVNKSQFVPVIFEPPCIHISFADFIRLTTITPSRRTDTDNLINKLQPV